MNVSRKPNHICKVCGTEYWACNDCDKTKSFLSWRATCDTPNCFNIYTTVALYDRGMIDKAEAAKNLKALDLSNKSTFHKGCQSIISEILGEDKVAAKKAVKPVKKSAKPEATDNDTKEKIKTTEA